MKIIPIILILAFIACNRVDTNSSIVGKWWGITGISNNEYVEINILDSVINVRTHWDHINSISYSIIEDSLYYYNLNYKVGYSKLNDTSLILSTRDGVDTIYKLNNSIKTYDEVRLLDSISRIEYFKAFNERAYKAYEIFGIVLPKFNDGKPFHIIEEEFPPHKKIE